MIISEKNLREIISLIIIKSERQVFDHIVSEGFLDRAQRLMGFGGADAADVATASGDDAAAYDTGGRGKLELNQKLSNAWGWIKPFMPAGATLTSGVRTQADQDRIIRNIAKKLKVDTSNLDKAYKEITSPPHNKIVARKIGRGHGAGEAMDIAAGSKSEFKQIADMVEKLSNDPDVPFKMQDWGKQPNPSLKEPKNGTYGVIHVGVVSADSVNSAKLASVVSKYKDSKVV